jgi:hypothetical protein
MARANASRSPGHRSSLSLRLDGTSARVPVEEVVDLPAAFSPFDEAMSMPRTRLLQPLPDLGGRQERGHIVGDETVRELA